MIRFCFPYSFSPLVPQKYDEVSEEKKIFLPFPKLLGLNSGIEFWYLHSFIRVPECNTSGIFRVPECRHTILYLLNSWWDYQSQSGTRTLDSGTLMKASFIIHDTRTQYQIMIPEVLKGRRKISCFSFCPRYQR